MGRSFVTMETFPHQRGCGSGAIVAGPAGILFPLFLASHWNVLPHPQPWKFLNLYLLVPIFYGNIILHILQGVNWSWWMVLLDLKDAYLHVLIRLPHWYYFRFGLRSPTVFQWKVLPFGVATAHILPQSWVLQFTYNCGPFASSGMSHVSIQQRCLPYSGVFTPGAFVSWPKSGSPVPDGFITHLLDTAFVLCQVMLHVGAFIDTCLWLHTLRLPGSP